MPYLARPLRGAAAPLLWLALAAMPARALTLMPGLPPLVTDVGVIAPAPSAGLFTAEAASFAGKPSAPPASAPDVFLRAWAAPGLAWLWNRAADPSLSLSPWSSVLDVARLGAFILPLRDDPAERANILLAAQGVDGAVIAPGAVFSFNKVVGERTPERGYQDGLMFDQGQIVRGTGGGICLVATALYNAALQAGLGVVERHAHSGVVSYAPPGCDASVVYGSEDMQFANTTGSPLVVSARIEPERVVIGLYGAPPPRGERVLLKTTHLRVLPAATTQTPDSTLPPGAAPVVDQKPCAGYDVVVERLWLAGRRVLRREVVASEHRAPRLGHIRVPVPPVLPVAAPPPPGTIPVPPLAVPGASPVSQPPVMGPTVSPPPLLPGTGTGPAADNHV